MKNMSKTCHSTFSVAFVYKAITKMQLFSFITALMFILVFSNAQSQTCQWAEKIAGTVFEDAKSIALDLQGNAYVTGAFTSATLTLNNGITLTNSGYLDAYVAKYNNKGICQWAVKIGGDDRDYTNSIAVDAFGNIYVAGCFESAILELNNGKTLSVDAEGEFDGFIAKYNSSGLCQWAEKLSGTKMDYASSIAVDTSGNVYIAGEYKSTTMTLNNGITLTNASPSNIVDGFIAKYNSEGKCQWAAKQAGTSADFATSIAVDASGNVYIAGQFLSTTLTLNNNKTLTNTGNADIFLAKYNSTGLCQWADKITGADNEYSGRIAVDSQGNTYIAGSFSSASLTLNNNKTLNKSGYFDAFIAMYDYTGLCQWVDKIAGTDNDYASTIALDLSGNMYVAGYFKSSTLKLNNGKTLTNGGNSDAYIAMFNSSGLCQWAEKQFGTDNDYVSSIAVHASGSVYFAGYFSSATLTLNNGKTLTSSGYDDAYIAKFMPNISLLTPVNFKKGMPWSGNILTVQALQNTTNYRFQLSTDSNFAAILMDTVVNKSSIELQKLSNNTRYYWRAKAYWANDTTGWSSVWNFTTRPIFYSMVLMKPMDNSTISTISPEFLWVSQEFATHYQLQLAKDNQLANIITTTIVSDANATFSNLLYNTKYYWRVRAMNSTDTSAWSLVWIFTTKAITPPSLLLPQNNSQLVSINPTLSWSSVQNPDSYRVHVFTYDTTNVQQSVETLPNSPAMYSWSSNTLTEKAWATFTRTEPVEATINSVVVSMTWDVDIASNMTVKIKHPDNSEYIIIDGTQRADGVSISNSSVTNFSIPINIFNGKPVSGEWSIWIEDIQGNGGAEISNASIEINHHIITQNNINNSIETTNTKTLSGLTPNKTHFWRVREIIGDQLSDWSELWNFTTETPTSIAQTTEIVNKAKLLITPQPATNEVFINIPYLHNIDKENIDVKLYNQAGQLAIDIDAKTNGNIIKLNTTELSSGVYQLIMNINGKKFSEKVVIVR